MLRLRVAVPSPLVKRALTRKAKSFKFGKPENSDRADLVRWPFEEGADQNSMVVVILAFVKAGSLVFEIDTIGTLDRYTDTTVVL